MNDRLPRLARATAEAQRHLADALQFASEDNEYGDECAREAMALAQVSLETFRKVLDQPVISEESSGVSMSRSTLPAQAEVPG